MDHPLNTEILNQTIELLQSKFSKREAQQMARWLLEELKGDEVNNDELREKIHRILEGEPFDYVIGNSVFYGRKFLVDPSVLIPRPETEELVEQCIMLISENWSSPNVLDIGTGSGCIAITIDLECSTVNTIGIDISEEALCVARQNKEILKSNVDFKKVDILDDSAVRELGHFHLIVSNPPYIPREESNLMSQSTLNYEPEVALFTEDDPLIFYKAIAEFSLTHLHHGGAVIFEVNEFRAKEVVLTLERSGYDRVEVKSDLQDKPRMVLGFLSR